MIGSVQYASQRGIVCCICAGPIALETSKTDERGKAVHEECYVRKSSIVVQFQLRLRMTDKLAKYRLTTH